MTDHLTVDDLLEIAERMVLDVAAGALEVPDIAAWLEERLVGAAQ